MADIWSCFRVAANMNPYDLVKQGDKQGDECDGSSLPSGQV